MLGWLVVPVFIDSTRGVSYQQQVVLLSCYCNNNIISFT